MKCSILSLCFILVAFCSYGQNVQQVHGFVYGDKKTPIAGAHISTEDGTLICVSDGKGQFSGVANVFVYRIVVTCDGYQSTTINLDGTFQGIRLHPLKQRTKQSDTLSTKLSIKEERKRIIPVGDIEPGWQNTITLSGEVVHVIDWGPLPTFGIDYVGGMRLNNTFFVGFGTGVSFNTSSLFDCTLLEKDGELAVAAHKLSAISVPVYANAKFYLTHTRIHPYTSLSIGVRLSGPQYLNYNDKLAEGVYDFVYSAFLNTVDMAPFSVKYGTYQLLANPSVGVDLRLRERNAITLQIGCQIITSPIITFDNNKANTLNVHVKNRVVTGLNCQIGFTF